MYFMYFKDYSNFLNENIRLESRLSKPVLDILNTQIKNELDSSQLYRYMSCWLEANSWTNTSKKFFIFADEELDHMRKIYKYIFDMNSEAIVPQTNTIVSKYDNIVELLEESLKQEMKVTEQWNNISNIALKNKDNTTYEFGQWFLKEQIEEENKFRNFLNKISLDMPKWKIEEIIG